MKEASGELNMTAITIIAIAAIAAFFYAFVWPALKSNITNSQRCAAANCPLSCTGASQKCMYLDGDNEIQITCPCKHGE